MAHKALIIYSSVTGNTEKIALAFEQTLHTYDFAVDVCRIGRHDFAAHPTYFEDYDLVCLGSPIMAGLPHQNMMQLLGLYGNEKIKFQRSVAHEAKSPLQFFLDGRPMHATKGVVFCTYSGYFFGPNEALPTLALERLYLENNGVAVVGEFCCNGKEVFHDAVNMVGAIMNVGVNRSAEMLQRYKDDPNDPLFARLTPEQRDSMDRCAKDTRHWPFDTMMKNDVLGDRPGSVFWHYDCMNRPHERDILKAKIFLSDLVEDYFMTATGEPRPSCSVYKVIS